MAAAAASAEALAARLAATARGANGAGWARRCRAALELEHLFWTCPEDEQAVVSELRADVSAAELRRRVARNARIHAALRDGANVRELAARESRLTFARWLFTPDEVVERILGRVRSSRAVIQPLAEEREYAPEAARALAALPEWERAIATQLAQAPRAFWTSRNGGDGDLVVSPPGTVVTTVHPPGSDLEIEIKRTGRPEPRPLSVVWERNGQRVPPSHRLDGGSTFDLLHFEAAASSRFSTVWRAIHGEEAPISRIIAVKAAYALPDGKREIPVLDYFIDEARRGVMTRTVRAFCEEAEQQQPELSGAFAIASQFLLRASPAQAVIAGTSAQRLDRITDREEVLVDAHDDHWRATRRLGAIWGTFLALGAGSHGESVVARNVGLKAVFRNGSWMVDLISMDHDNLQIARSYDEAFDAAYILDANVKDEIALVGGPYKGAVVRGSLEFLGDIYGVDRDTTLAIFFAAAREAFVRCVDALDGAAGKLFAPKFVDALRRWRKAVARFIAGSRATNGAIEKHGDFLRRHAQVWGA